MLWEFKPKPCDNTWTLQGHLSPLDTASIKDKISQRKQKVDHCSHAHLVMPGAPQTLEPYQPYMV